MFAVRSGRNSKAGVRAAARFGSSSIRGGFVLPRWLRRPARLLVRLTSGDFEPPRYAVTMMTAAFFALTGIYGSYVAGTVPVLLEGVTSRTGFAVDQVRVTGHKETSEIDVLGRLELDGWTSLVGFDAEAARQRVAELPWVETASVRKVYPDALEVHITERKPFALWQNGSALSIIEASGRVIAPFAGGRFAALPLVIGLGADEAAAGFVRKIAGYGELAPRIKAYMRVAERRWDLRLENGITIKLPEFGEDGAIRELLAMDRDDGLLSRDITAVDLRLADRVVVQLTPGAVTSLAASMKERISGASTRLEKRI